jgi:hypothetical protein
MPKHPSRPAEPTVQNVPFSLTIRAELSDSESAERAKKKLIDLYTAINEYCLVKYGTGLRVDDFTRYVELALVPHGGPRS